jgi:hypothetical protein
MNNTKGRLHASMGGFGPHALDVRRSRNYRLKKLRVHNHSGAAFLGAALATKASSPNPFAGTDGVACHCLLTDIVGLICWRDIAEHLSVMMFVSYSDNSALLNSL